MKIFESLNFRSRLIAAMLAAAALTGLTQAWLGNENVRSGFERRLDGRLQAINAMTNSEVELYFSNVIGTVAALGANIMVAESLDAFAKGAITVDGYAYTDEMQQALTSYYKNQVLGQVFAKGAKDPVLDSYLPDSNRARFLQYFYVAANKSVPKSKLSTVGGDWAYDIAHLKYHEGLKAMSDAFSFADLFLITPNGDVVYSVAKEADFQANLLSGAFNGSGLARAFMAAREQRGIRPVIIEDFSLYEPSMGAPNAFVATPVFEGKHFLGVVAIQLAGKTINKIVTKNAGWERIGLGKTGDIYIIGNDKTYRTTSRPFEEDRETFLAASQRGGTEKSVIESMTTFNTPIKLQRSEIASDVTGQPLAKSELRKNALGQKVLAYASPLKIPGLDWVTVTEVNEKEANEQTKAFQRLMMIALALTTAMTTIGAMLLSGMLTRPLRQVYASLTRAAEGDLKTQLSLSRSDEVGDISRAAQGLLDTLRTKLSESENSKIDSSRLLKRFLPELTVRSLMQEPGNDGTLGAKLEDITGKVREASYIVARISGHMNMSSDEGDEAAFESYRNIVQLMDVAAERSGVEKVRMAGGTFFAVSGLSSPHLDHRQRALAFSHDALSAIKRLGHDKTLKLEIRIGISSGPAIHGLVGRDQLEFDVWGKAVFEAEALSLEARSNEARVSTSFAEALKGEVQFAPASNSKLKAFSTMIAEEKKTTSRKAKA